MVYTIQRHHSHHHDDRLLLPAVRLVSVLHETLGEHGLEALVETARADYGLESDWTTEAIEAAKAHAAELARMLQ